MDVRAVHAKRAAIWTALAVLAAAALIMIRPQEASAATLLLVPQDFPSVQAAVNAADPGDTIKLNPRKYRESVDVTVNNITITGRVGEGRTTIISRPASGVFDHGFDIDANGVRVQRLTIRSPLNDGVDADGKNTQISNVRVDGDSGDDCLELDGNNVLVRNSHLEACGEDAVDLDGRGMTIVNNVVHGSDDWGIEADGHKALIAGNLIRGTNHQAIGLDGNEGMIRNNLINPGGHSPGIDVDSANHVVVRNNVIIGAEEGVEYDGENPVIRNNVARSFDSDGFDVNCFDRAGGAPAGQACANGVVANNFARGQFDHDSLFEVDVPDGTGSLKIVDNVGRVSANDGFNLDTDNALIARNLAVGAGFQSDDAGFDIDGDDNRILDNVARSNANQGFNINGNNNRIQDNLAKRNNSDGLHVEGNANRVRDNRAVENAADGIENGGGATNTRLINNSARDNMRNRDCVNDGTIANKSGNNCADGSNFNTASSGIDMPVI